MAQRNLVKKFELDLAILKGDEAGIRNAIDNGGDLDRSLASLYGVAPKTLMTLVYTFGANINARGPGGRTLLMHLASNGPSSAETMRVAMMLGARARARDDGGCTALMYAARQGNVPGLEILLNVDAKINLGDDMGKTALMYAAERGQAKAVRVLLEAGADPDLVDDNGKNAYAYARQSDIVGPVQVVKDLLIHHKPALVSWQNDSVDHITRPPFF